MSRSRAVSEVLLEVEGITKRFDGVTAVDGVSFDVSAHELVGLVGHNGSGKSTLLKVLAGYYHPDDGRFAVGRNLSAHTGSARHRSGARAVHMSFVHQDLGLVPTLDVTDNLALGGGFPARRFGLVSLSRARAHARRLLQQYEIPAEPDTLVKDLSLADRTLLAMGRALGRFGPAETPVLVLDEPTASLPEREVGKVLDAMVRLVDRGGAVIFVSHRLDEVLHVANRVLVMRDGALVADEARAQLSERRLVRHMFGEQFEAVDIREDAAPTGDARLEVEGLAGGIIEDFTVSVAAGEIVGVTGLLGCGTGDLAKLLSGARTASAGRIRVDGRPVDIRHPRNAVDAGVGYVPADRLRDGGLLHMSATENLTLPDLRSFVRPLTRFLDKRAEQQATMEWMERAKVRPPLPSRDFAAFSGGNQQKLVYGRWVRLAPKVLVLDEPARGVDVEAVGDLYEIIRQQAQQGTTVVLMSSEWDDLPRLCHRVIVLDRGRVVAELEDTELTLEKIASVAYTPAADPGYAAGSQGAGS